MFVKRNARKYPVKAEMSDKKIATANPAVINTNIYQEMNRLPEIN